VQVARVLFVSIAVLAGTATMAFGQTVKKQPAAGPS
jgi:hypothetical protein